MVTIRSLILAALLMGLQAGCSSGGSPEIKQADMVRILVDAHLADADYKMGPHNYNPQDSTEKKIYDSIVVKAGYKPSQFAQSYTYFTARPDKFSELYDSVIQTLNLKTIQTQAALAKARREQAKADSVDRAQHPEKYPKTTPTVAPPRPTAQPLRAPFKQHLPPRGKPKPPEP